MTDKMPETEELMELTEKIMELVSKFSDKPLIQIGFLESIKLSLHYQAGCSQR